MTSKGLLQPRLFSDSVISNLLQGSMRGRGDPELNRVLLIPFMHFFSFSFFSLNFQFSKELHCLFVYSLFELWNTNLILK